MKRVSCLLLLALVACAKSEPAKAPAAQPLSFAEFQALEAGSRLVTDSPSCTEAKSLIPEVSCKDLRQEFRYVVYVGKQIYCYWEEKKADTGTDFSALATELESSITDTTSYSEYFLLLRRWASAFHDGHVNAMTGDDLSLLEIFTSPVRLEVFAPATDHEKVVVSAVTGVPSLAAGDQVLEVNGVPVSMALTEASEKQSSGSTAAMRRLSAARRLVDVIGNRLGTEPFTLKVVHKDAELVVNIPRKAELNLPPDPSKKPAEDEDASKLIAATVMPGGIGYLKIDAFVGNMEKLIPVAMDRLHNTKGLVIDMRTNGGGDQSGSKIIARMIENKVTRYKVSPRNSDYLLSQRPYYFLDGIDASLPFAPWTSIEVEPSPADKSYRGRPVVVLTRPFCFSACDTFVAGLKANGLATVLGENTGGGTGTPLVFTLPKTELQFRYSVVRGLTAKDEPIEGKGTPPDVALEARPEDRFAGKDPQLDAALELVSKASGVQPPPGESRPVTFQPQPLDQSPTKVEDALVKKLSRYLEY